MVSHTSQYLRSFWTYFLSLLSPKYARFMEMMVVMVRSMVCKLLYTTSIEEYFSHCMGLRFMKEFKLLARVKDSVLH